MAKYKFSIEGEESLPLVTKSLLSKGAPPAAAPARAKKEQPGYAVGKVSHVHPRSAGDRHTRVSVEHHGGKISNVAIPNRLASELKAGQRVRLSIGPHKEVDRFENMGFEGKTANPLGQRAKDKIYREPKENK